VGMGEDLFERCPDLLGDRSDDVLGWSLRDMCLQGPEDMLTRTEHAQPALFALSMALWQLFDSELTVAPAGASGHSLGEYSALTAAGHFKYDDALKAVSRRGRAMASAADREPSGMVALIGGTQADAEEIANRRAALGGRLEVANINAPGQVVMAGGVEDISWLVANSRELGVRRAIELSVAAAFHSSFMAMAQPDVERALAETPIGPSAFPVWSNTTGQPHIQDDTADTLVRQIVSPVRFSESLMNMYQTGISTFVHVGPGDVTAGMAGRTLPGAKVFVISKVDDITDVADAIGTM
jgi:[acyl-carrier-protein] S-malonyltransferase